MATAKAPVVPEFQQNKTTGKDAIVESGSGLNTDGSNVVSQASLNQAALDAAAKAEATRREGQSAYDLLYNEFKLYGLESLVAPLKGLITSGASPSEFTMKLRETPEYQQRFAANKERISQGLTALDEATYLAKEDAYQNLMRQYGLPQSYYLKDSTGRQSGFEKLIANDVSAVELENRLQQAADILDKSPQEYLRTLQTWYPEINKSDLMAYVLDPKNALTSITNKIGAAKIGGEYAIGGLGLSEGRAEELRRQGVTAEQARQGVQAIKENAQRGSELAAMYNLGPYGQSDVEAEVYNLGGAAEAKKKRQKIVDTATAGFSGSSGVGALGRDRVSNYNTTQSGYGAY